MKGRPIFSKNKILVALVALFTMLMCVSVGFATWITTGGSSSTLNGNIDADDVVSGGGEPVDCITIDSTTGAKYYSGTEATGFVSPSGVYDKRNGILSFTATMDLTSARTVIPSLNASGTFNFNIVLSTNVSVSGLTADMDDPGLVVKSNYSTLVSADIPEVGSPVQNTEGTNELINVTYPISHLTRTNHTTLTITGNMTFSFESDVFTTELANFQNGTHKFIISLGAN